jgi:trimeric autotransporter adhesin
MKSLIFPILALFLLTTCSSDDNSTANPQPIIINPPITTPGHFKSIAGTTTVLAVKEDGTLWACGKNVSGLLANGSAAQSSANFAAVQIGMENDWKEVSASDGSGDAIALKTDGSIWRWGAMPNQYLQTQFVYAPQRIGTDNDWKTVDTGGLAWLGIKNDGSLWGWGAGSRLGLGDSSAFQTIPVLLDSSQYKEIASQGNSSVVLKNDGTIWACGNNTFGELGNGTTNLSNVFIQVGTANNWKHISAGYSSCFGIKEDGTLWSWGSNLFGGLGQGHQDDVHIPQQVGTDSDWSQAVYSGFNTLMLKNNGTIWVCGGILQNHVGGLINDIQQSYSPVKVSTATDWVSIDGVYNAIYAKKADGGWWGMGAETFLNVGLTDDPVLQMVPFNLE